ncbi:hypothetical protein [Ktedonospora formicarum]|uniref:Uncharacterized protein n=1 Tax=Ktedonospora formicarum TaxID=2778364 RepID=A0A8J3I317_9CHLR|nr:hypothetical protein [Ktedonospora formicarum]GHO45307.1 hypothetical protein KSX_34700 [Ktedonospora formicarum]
MQTQAPAEPILPFTDALSDDDLDATNTGVVIGRQPATLHIRGWLASHSVRAMALFELLACGRRVMPFGYLPGDPYGSYIGYLTPTETSSLASRLEGLQAPEMHEAEAEHQAFLRHQSLESEHSKRMIDEVAPIHAGAFLDAVRIAAQQRLGLICSIG